MAFVALILFVSCNKTSIVEPETSTTQQRESGLLPDPPELKAKMDIKVSREFLEHGRTLAFNRFGKKIVDMRADDAEVLMRGTAAKGTTSRGGTKGGGWGQGGNPASGGTGGTTGGGTTGGGGTVTPTDYTPPRIVGVEPANGTNFTLQNNSAGRTDLFAWVDDETKLARIQVTVRGDIVFDQTTGLKSGYGNWNATNIPYYFPYGDGTYDMTWKAWDSAGNVTIVSSVFSRNTDFTVLPADMPTSVVLPYPKDPYINQGGEGSCAAFAVNSAFTIQKYVRGGLTAGYNENNIYSPEWIYNLGKGGATGCGSGSSILGNMSYVCNRGVPTWAVLPYSYNNGCDTSIFTDAIRANAALNKGIWGFASATADINAIKYNIYRGYVGAFGYQLDHQINGGFLYPGFIWTFPHFQDGGPHASCIIGYDDSKHAFLMLNSWSSAWGDQGTIWVDYDFMWQALTGALYYFGN